MYSIRVELVAVFCFRFMYARLCKYPLLLNTLKDKGELDEEKRAAIERGTVAITNILDFTNSYLAKQEQHKIVQDLKDQVEDWKSHRVEAFGELLLHGTFVVIKGDGMNTEREVSSIRSCKE